MSHGIRGKLLSTFVVIALFTGALGWYAVTTIERLNNDQRTMYGDVFGGTHLLANWLDKSWESRSALLPYLLGDDPAERDQLRQEMASLDTELAVLTTLMDQADTDREDVETLAGLTGAWQAYDAWRLREVISRVQAGDADGAMRAYQTDGVRLMRDLDRAIDAYVTKKAEVAGTLEANSEASYDRTRGIAIGMFVAAAAVGLMIGFFLARSIASRVGQVAVAAEGLATGDLDQRINVRSRDEIGKMAEAFRAMIAYQQQMARVANAIAQGDLSQNVQPKSERDVLGNAFERMTGNLRVLVGRLEDAARKANALLDQNAHLHERLQQAARRTTALNEQSLRRISADLHDGPGQALALALMRLDNLHRSLRTLGEYLSDDVEAGILDAGESTLARDFAIIQGAVRDALSEIRAISTGLRLPELTPLTVAQVIERAVRDHERRAGTPVSVRIEREPIAAPLAIKIALFRALQEALSNATRHGLGAEIAVHVRAESGRLHMTVSDQGPGFEPEHVEHKGRLGLASMRERAELLGGTFCVWSAPGRGARVDLVWPLRDASSMPADVAEVTQISGPSLVFAMNAAAV